MPVRRLHHRRARAAQLLVQLAPRRLPRLHRSRDAPRDRPRSGRAGQALSVAKGALLGPWARMPMADSWFSKVVEAVTRAHGWDPDVPVAKLPPEALDYLLNATKGEQVVIGYRHERGENTLLGHASRASSSTSSPALPRDRFGVRQDRARAVHGQPALPDLRRQAAQARVLGVTVDGRSISDVADAVDHRRARLDRGGCRSGSPSARRRSPASCSRRSPLGWASWSTSASTT